MTDLGLGVAAALACLCAYSCVRRLRLVRRALAEAQDRAQALQSLFERTPTPALALDERHIIVLANQAFRAEFCADKDSVAGRHLRSVVGEDAAYQLTRNSQCAVAGALALEGVRPSPANSSVQRRSGT